MSATTLRTYALLAAGAACIAALAATFWWQSSTIARLEESNAALVERSTLAESRAEASVAALIESEAERLRADSAVAGRDKQVEALNTKVGALQKQLREAAKNETNLDRRVHPDIADALCVQYAAASGYAVRSGQGDAPGSAGARAGDTVAGWRYVPALDCSQWREITYRGLVEWPGGLLSHAGIEREDKAAQRQWSAREGR